MLTVLIPDEIDKQLSAITNDKEEFVINAIKQKINSRDTIAAGKLAKEYADSINENKIITDDYKFADNENINDY